MISPAILGVYLLFALPASAQKKNLKYNLYLAYEAEDIAREQFPVATILSGEEPEVDGIEVTVENMRYANRTPPRPNSVVADVTPGLHKVKVLNHISGADIIMEPLEHEFEAGKVYRIGIKFLKIVIEEHSNENIKAQIAGIRSGPKLTIPGNSLCNVRFDTQMIPKPFVRHRFKQVKTL